MVYVPTCLRASVVYVPTCLRTNMPKACQVLIFTCQRAIRRANVSSQFFKHSSYEMLREISILCYYIKKFYIILDIILIHIMCVCIVHINCIILYFLKLFWSLGRNGNIKTPGFYTLQVTREYSDLLEL